MTTRSESLSESLLIGFHTDAGPRESNQDAILSTSLPNGKWLLAVADGMGGLAEGERASRMALQELARQLVGGTSLMEAFQHANEVVYEEARGQSMGTTLVAAVLDERGAEVAHVGDSRAYHLDPLGLVQITRDHTMAREATETGAILEAQDAPDRWAGALARYLGAEKTVEVEHHGLVVLHEGGWLLLCSDGLHGVLSSGDMETCLAEATDPSDAARHLVASALERKTEDNVSAALVLRPGKKLQPAAPGPAEEQESPWDPEALLSRSPRTTNRRRRMRALTITSLILIPIVIVLALSLIWAWHPSNP